LKGLCRFVRVVFGIARARVRFGFVAMTGRPVGVPAARCDLIRAVAGDAIRNNKSVRSRKTDVL
jgi:hypothetical protein